MRWLKRCAVALATLLIVVLVTAQVILSTSIPRRIVIAQVQNALGLRISAESVATGWLGHTTLKNVTVALPLAERAFLEIPELRVTHTALPVLLATQSIQIQSIELDRPLIYVRQDTDRHWNLQDVAQILLRLGGNTQPPTSQKPSSLALPIVQLRGGVIDIADNQGRRAIVQPIDLTGRPSGALVWTYQLTCDGDAGEKCNVSGRIVPSDNFAHEVDFSISQFAGLLHPWLASIDPNAQVEGSWRGIKSGDGVVGSLALRSLKYAPISVAQAEIAINASAASITVRPSKLPLRGPSPIGSAAVTGGSIYLDPSIVRASHLEISALNGRALIDGAFTFTDQSGHLDMRWQGLSPATGFRSDGSIQAALRTDWPALHQLQATCSTSGTAAGNAYTARFDLVGSGKEWNAATWTLAAPTLQLSDHTPLALDGLTAHFSTTPGVIALTDFSLGPSNSIAGQGAIRYASPDMSWWLDLRGQHLAIPRAAEAQLAFEANAWGTSDEIRLQRAYAIVGRAFAQADGYYHFARPKPVELNLSLSELPAPIDGAPDVIGGSFHGEANLYGAAFPPSFDANGQLHGDNVVLAHHPPQQIALKFTAGLHDRLLKFKTETLSLLGGQWSIDAQLPARDIRRGSVPDVTLNVANLPLANLGDLANQQQIAGTASANVELDIEQPTIDQIYGTGHFHADDVSVRQFHADVIDGDLTVDTGGIALSPIHLRQRDGQATVHATSTLAHLQHLTAKLDAHAWPIDVGAAHALLDVSTGPMQIDAAKQSATGTLCFDTTARWQDHPVLAGRGAIGLDGRVIELQNLQADLLRGNVAGTARLDLDQPMASRASVRWDALNLAALGKIDPLYGGAVGFITGRADLAPLTDPRALAPLQLDIATVGQAVNVRGLQFTQAHLPIYLDHDRAVCTGGNIEIAGGQVGVFARSSLHVDQVLSTLVQLQLDRLDLQQLLHVLDQTQTDKLKSYPGRLSGIISILGDPRDRRQIFGQASLQIAESDLANFGPFAALYNIMHLSGSDGKKAGAGTLEARYDNDSLIVSSLRYFNRGADAYGLASIAHLSQYPDCPLSGELVGTVRLLKNIDLPFFADADKIFSVLQSNLTSIVIGGTLAKPSYVPESASAIGTAMRTFLLGDVPQPK
jgi:hypothetical protein